MAKKYEPRRKISFVLLVITGLLLGLAIKHVAIGIVIGLVFGLLASGIVSRD